MRVLLDTNAYSAMRLGDRIVAEQVQRAEAILLSVIVVGELLFGFRNGSRYEENTRALRIFLEEPSVILMPITWSTAEHCGHISTALRRRGTPIPTNDIWLAAQAMEAEATRPLASAIEASRCHGSTWRRISSRRALGCASRRPR